MVTVVTILLLAGLWCILVAGANLNAYPAESQESNDYGEKHRSS